MVLPVRVDLSCGLRCLAVEVVGFPLVVIGCNCIFVYLLNWTIKGSIIAALHRHFGTLFLSNASPEFQELFTGLGVLTIFWLLLFWMYRNKVFVKL